MRRCKAQYPYSRFVRNARTSCPYRKATGVIRTSATPHWSKPISRAASSERSIIRRPRGMQSFTRTTTERSPSRRVTRTRVPIGRTGEAAESRSFSSGSPVQVRTSRGPRRYHDAMPTTDGPMATAGRTGAEKGRLPGGPRIGAREPAAASCVAPVLHAPKATASPISANPAATRVRAASRIGAARPHQGPVFRAVAKALPALPLMARADPDASGARVRFIDGPFPPTCLTRIATLAGSVARRPTSRPTGQSRPSRTISG